MYHCSEQLRFVSSVTLVSVVLLRPLCTFFASLVDLNAPNAVQLRRGCSLSVHKNDVFGITTELPGTFVIVKNPTLD